VNISSIIDIIDGELQNSPSISFIYNIKVNPNKILEGDLFLAKNSKEINEAIKNGAFAIVYDFEIEILDKEIAWIKVDSINNALKKLFRYKLSTLDLTVFYCDIPTFDLLNIYKSSNKDIRFISSKLENSIKIIENIKAVEILFCKDKELLKDIYPKYKNFNTNNYKIGNLIKHSLFETSFSFEDSFFSKLKISSLYINQFLDVYNYLNREIDLKKLIQFEHLKPIFIDKLINIIDFGKSNKFVLIQKNFELVQNELDFIETNYKYAKTICISSFYNEKINKEQIVLENLNKLKNFLINKDFNAIYIVGYDKSKIEEILNLSSIKKINLF